MARVAEGIPAAAAEEAAARDVEANATARKPLAAEEAGD